MDWTSLFPFVTFAFGMMFVAALVAIPVWGLNRFIRFVTVSIKNTIHAIRR